MATDPRIAKVNSLKTRFQKTLEDPCQASPQDILGFFLGVEYGGDDFDQKIRQGHVIEDMVPLWFGSPLQDYDGLCRSLKPMIEKVAAKGLASEDWSCTVDGRMAQLVLLDQLSRNVYRGTKEAYAFDALGLAHANILAQHYLLEEQSSSTLEGSIHLPYVAFLATAFIHSEKEEDVAKSLELLDASQNRVPEHRLGGTKMQRAMAVSHLEVLRRFGRYPHRNQCLGRARTPQEEEYLADVENLPAWAKSQI